MSGEGVSNPLDETQILSDIADLQSDLDDLTADVVLLQADVDVIRAQTDAMAVLEETAGQITTDGTEQNIYINNAPAGVFKPICLKLDCTNHTGTETIVVRTYYRNENGGNLILQDLATYIGLITPELLNIELDPNRYGFSVTIEKTAGTNRGYNWEVFYEV